MGTLFRNNNRKFSAALLLVFVWYLAGITMFPHTHVVDGGVITHSHPYSGTPDDPHHTHSQSQFFAIGHLAMSFLACVLTAFTARVFLSPRRIIRGERSIRTTWNISLHYDKRGPPCALSC